LLVLRSLVMTRVRASVALVILASLCAGCSLDLVDSGEDDDPPATVPVPNLIGVNLPTARKILRTDQLGTPPPGKCPRVPGGGVIEQWPAAGTVVTPGTAVNLRIEQMHSSGIVEPADGWLTCDVTGLSP
jgi:hypothetical protein